MPELKLGTKFECYNCGTKFYDLGKSAAICPKCGADQKDAVTSESPAVSQAARRRRKADVPKPIDIEEDEPIVEDIAAAPDDEMVGPALDDDEIEEEEEDFDDEA
ncbi:MAG: TIGR02300 family protein [Thermoanaerobaculia bacterium]